MRSRGVKFCLENWGGFAEQVVINLGFERGTRRIQLLGVGGGGGRHPGRGTGLWGRCAGRSGTDVGPHGRVIVKVVRTGDPGTSLISNPSPSSSCDERRTLHSL